MIHIKVSINPLAGQFTRNRNMSRTWTTLCAFPERFAQFIEYDDSGVALGLAEVSLRTDYVNGTVTSPVAFLEGIYVVSQARRSGIAQRLIAETERWALNVGCRELASDAPLENIDSHAMQAALGFSESERVVFFKKTLWSQMDNNACTCPQPDSPNAQSTAQPGAAHLEAWA
jgi:aminoglycoside 6'-N-acetyltransferase I